MIQLGRSGASTGNAEERRALRSHFDAHHYVHLSRFLDVDLLSVVSGEIERAEFYERRHEAIKLELCLKEDAVLLRALWFVANDPNLFEFVREISGCGPIGCFEGRVYKMDPSLGHYDSWHDDVFDDRLIAMSINIGSARYEGGVLQIREIGSAAAPLEAPNPGYGDAILFRVAPHLEHQVSQVRGTVPKTAYAGWFKAGTPNLKASVTASTR